MDMKYSNPENKLFPALTIGSDIGIFEDEVNPTIKRFLEYCSRCGEHFTLCYTPPGYSYKSIRKGLRLFPTNSRYRFLFPLDAVSQGRKIIRRWRPEVIVAQDTFFFGLVGLVLKKMFGLPLVVHYHSGFFSNPYWLAEKRYHRLMTWLGLFVSRRADAIRTVSTDIKNDLLKKGIDPERIFYATPPVEEKGFLYVNKEKEKELIGRFSLNTDKTFLFIGRLSKEKNLPMIIGAVARLSEDYPDLKLMIIGKGPEEKMLRRMVLEKGLTDQVVFTGAIPHNELKDYIRISCALLISSHYEGTAKVIKEAAFAGKTTISTKTSGVSDAIKDGQTGLILPVGNEPAFTDAMDYLLKNPNRSSEMGARARTFILEKFDYKKDVDRIVNVWRQAVFMSKDRKQRTLMIPKTWANNTNRTRR